MLAMRNLWQRLIRALGAPTAHAPEPTAAQQAAQAPATPPASERRIATGRLFELSPELLAELRALRPFCDYEDRILWEHDAFPLDGSDGPGSYLSADGRLIWRDQARSLVPTQGLVFATLVRGARHTGVHGLLALLPRRPAGANTCRGCAGSGFTLPAGVDQAGATEVCPSCAGLGWVSAALDLHARAPEPGAAR